MVGRSRHVVQRCTCAFSRNQDGRGTLRKRHWIVVGVLCTQELGLEAPSAQAKRHAFADPDQALAALPQGLCVLLAQLQGELHQPFVHVKETMTMSLLTRSLLKKRKNFLQVKSFSRDEREKLEWHQLQQDNLGKALLPGRPHSHHPLHSPPLRRCCPNVVALCHEP